MLEEVERINRGLQDPQLHKCSKEANKIKRDGWRKPPKQNKQTKHGDGTHPYKNATHYSERHQKSMSSKKRFILDRYNPLEQVLK